MQTALVVILVAAVLADASVIPEGLFSEEHIRRVNEEATTWTAGKNFPDGTTLAHIKSLLGLLHKPERSLLPKEDDYGISDDEIPDSFDAREQWPKCESIKQIADQSACGSCWAVAAASAISDRICIHSNGAKQTLVSAADLISCCGFKCGMGCQGGYDDEAWSYWVQTGIVTGGGYNSGIGCKSYPFPECAHHVNSTKYDPCPKTKPTPACVKKCDKDELVYSEEKVKGKTAYSISGARPLQKEILANGPVEVGFRVYDDFPLYKSGVYRKGQSTKYLGGHAVRILGWGNENGNDYWLVANSWNEGWGDNGLFKIQRGHNECSFESEGSAGIPE